MSDDLIAWLRAQLDDDERVAQHAMTARRWEAESGSYGPEVRVGNGDLDHRGPEWSRQVNYVVWRCEDGDEDCPAEAAAWMAEAEHIARWDPARVLAEIEAKRKVIEAEQDRVIEEGPLPERMRDLIETDVIKLLAQPYANRSGFREEWRP